MHKESKTFEVILLKHISNFERYRYYIKEIQIPNENTSEEFINISLFNKPLSKYITLTFYNSSREITNNEICVGLSKLDKNGNWSSFDISAFLAYKKLNRIIKYEDKEEYRFKVNPENLEPSIKKQLERIKNILSEDLYKILTTDKWINIPIHDPRDNY